MSDPLTTSRTARESLARGLNALQADPTVPSHLVDLAAPIAQAMGALHQLERTNQLAPHADVALTHMRGALSRLQAAASNHPAVANALENVAKSLTLVHSLSKMAEAGAPGPAAAPARPQSSPMIAAAPMGQPPPPQARPNTAGMQGSPAGPAAPFQQPPQAPPFPHQPPQAAPFQQQPPQAPPFQQQPPPFQQQPPPFQQQPPQPPAFPQQPPRGASFPQQPPHGAPFPQPQPAFPHAAAVNPNAATAAAPGGFKSGPMVARDPFAAPAPMAGGSKPATPSMPVPAPPPPGNAQLIAADLGAHSATNFYKGLSGNDIIDHGGLFVSTYVPPKLGTAIRLKVSLPGGYEFEANAVVRWTRDEGGDAPPGFGAQFTGITNEARQLVYRYVRNREPLFHDDL